MKTVHLFSLKEKKSLANIIAALLYVYTKLCYSDKAIK